MSDDSDEFSHLQDKQHVSTIHQTSHRLILKSCKPHNENQENDENKGNHNEQSPSLAKHPIVTYFEAQLGPNTRMMDSVKNILVPTNNYDEDDILAEVDRETDFQYALSKIMTVQQKAISSEAEKGIPKNSLVSFPIIITTFNEIDALAYKAALDYSVMDKVPTFIFKKLMWNKNWMYATDKNIVIADASLPMKNVNTFINGATDSDFNRRFAKRIGRIRLVQLLKKIFYAFRISMSFGVRFWNRKLYLECMGYQQDPVTILTTWNSDWKSAQSRWIEFESNQIFEILEEHMSFNQNLTQSWKTQIGQMLLNVVQHAVNEQMKIYKPAWQKFQNNN